MDLFAELNPLTTAAILSASFAGSFITAAFGIGGGIALLSVLASLLPPAAVIPIHGIVQVGSNAGRWAIFAKHFNALSLLPFAAGTIAGAVLGGLLVIDLRPGLLQLALGLFVLWSVYGKPPAFLQKSAALNGVFSSFLTMFVGGTGPFVATYIKTLKLDRMSHTATQAAFMTVQHLTKTIVFGTLGFAFGAWLLLIAAMIAAGVLGTLTGKRILLRINDKIFKQALNIALTLLALRLIYQGVTTLV